MSIPTLADFNLQPGTLVTLAVSGGPDSLALLHYLHGLGWPLQVASFDHCLRPTSAEDVAFVSAFAHELGLPCVTGSADVAGYAATKGLSTEEAARELRYRFLFNTARASGAQAVVTGHTADDQAETVLMHFLRGAGLAGLKGMPARVILAAFDAEISIIRPLLGWTRAETEAYCREHNLAARIDDTNTDTRYFRNRLRHELLPALESYNPHIRQALSKTAQALQGDYELLNDVIDGAWQNCVSAVDPGCVTFDLARLTDQPAALRRNLFRRAAALLKPGLRDVDFAALERAARLAPCDLAGGLKTKLEGERLYLAANAAALPRAAWPQVAQSVTLLPGQYPLGNDWVLTCQEDDGAQLYQRASTNPLLFTAWLAADALSENIIARGYHSGDRFEPLGMPHQTSKLAELFINQKIPKRLRQHWPVICVNDEIAWVAGLRLSERYKITEQTRKAVKIEIEKKMGPV